MKTKSKNRNRNRNRNKSKSKSKNRNKSKNRRYKRKSMRIVKGGHVSNDHTNEYILNYNLDPCPYTTT